MRLTVNLEKAHYQAAKALSKAEDCSLSAAVNRLIGRGFERVPAVSPGTGQKLFPVSRGGRTVTSDLVAELDRNG